LDMDSLKRKKRKAKMKHAADQGKLKGWDKLRKATNHLDGKGERRPGDS